MNRYATNPHTSTIGRLMIRALQRASEPMTVAQLAAATRASPVTITPMVRTLHDAGELHYPAWAEAKTGQYVRLIAWGAGVDAPRPEPKPKHKRETKGFRGLGVTRSRVLAAITKGPASARTISATLYLSLTHSSRLLRELAQSGEAHIVGFEDTPRGTKAAIYSSKAPHRPVRQPKCRNQAQIKQRVADRIEAAYGREVADAITGSMFRGKRVSRVIVEGRPIYEHGRGLLVKLGTGSESRA